MNKTNYLQYTIACVTLSFILLPTALLIRYAYKIDKCVTQHKIERNGSTPIFVRNWCEAEIFCEKYKCNK